LLIPHALTRGLALIKGYVPGFGITYCYGLQIKVLSALKLISLITTIISGEEGIIRHTGIISHLPLNTKEMTQCLKDWLNEIIFQLGLLIGR